MKIIFALARLCAHLKKYIRAGAVRLIPRNNFFAPPRLSAYPKKKILHRRGSARRLSKKNFLRRRGSALIQKKKSRAGAARRFPKNKKCADAARRFSKKKFLRRRVICYCAALMESALAVDIPGPEGAKNLGLSLEKLTLIETFNLNLA